MMIEFLSTNLNDLANYLFDANKRLYWVYLVSAFAMATLVFWLRTRTLAPTKLFSFIFPANVYLASSAKQDYALFIVNKLIRAALFPLVVLTMAPIGIAVASGLETVFGTREFITLSAFSIMMIFTVLLFLFDDFTRFFLHWAMHKIPLLWEFHKVHHSAKVLTPMTVYRSHPIENYLYACRMALTQGAVVGICYYLFGPNLKMIDILGANLFVFGFNVLGSNLRHSHIWVSFGDKIENWLISPAQHQIHHSDDPAHFEANMGTALAIWDRMFGTHLPASAVDKINYGVSETSADHSSLLKIYYTPFTALFKRAKSGRSLFKFR